MDSRRILLFLIIGILGGYAWWRMEHRDGRRLPEKFTPAEAPKLSLDDVKVLAALDAEYVKLVQSVTPSVVSITSSRDVWNRVPLTMDDLLRGQQRVQKGTSTSLGSGVIVSKEGHILTNRHVIAGMTEVRVQLTDGRNAAAAVIGSDSATDIAVLRIDEKNLEPLLLGDSDELRAGQQVFAVGNPYGLEESVSRGIVSAKGRRTASDGVEFIQHDAAVNPGNSGGPLLNLRGEIIGINTAIFTRRQDVGFQGISFAVPSKTAQRVMEAIISRGRLVRPYLGLAMQDVTPLIARSFGLADTSGAIIADVVANSPAARAGLRPGDVVLGFAGKPVKNAQELGRMIAAAEVGKNVEIDVVREGKRGKAAAIIGEVPALAQ